MQQDPDPIPKPLADPSDGLEAVPEGPRRMMCNLVVDQITIEVIAALRERRVGVILLKGPSIARWIYEPGARSYVDIDLLIRPQDGATAAEVLAKLGFQTQAPPSLPFDRPTYQEWSRRPHEPVIDVHPTLNLLEQLPPDLVWDVLAENSGDLELLGRQIRVLGPAARALHMALHAYSHGTTSPQAQADLTRALSALEPDIWDSAARIADRLGATPVLAAALRSDPQGARMAQDLGLSGESSTAVEVRRRAKTQREQWAALGVDWWLRQGTRGKISLLLRKMFPRPAYLRARSRVAAKGGAWLVAAYVARPFVILGWGARGAFALLTSRRTDR